MYHGWSIQTILRDKGKVLNGLLGDGGDLLGDGGNLLGDGEHPGSSMQLFKWSLIDSSRKKCVTNQPTYQLTSVLGARDACASKNHAWSLSVQPFLCWCSSSSIWEEALVCGATQSHPTPRQASTPCATSASVLRKHLKGVKKHINYLDKWVYPKSNHLKLLGMKVFWKDWSQKLAWFSSGFHGGDNMMHRGWWHWVARVLSSEVSSTLTRLSSGLSEVISVLSLLFKFTFECARTTVQV